MKNIQQEGKKEEYIKGVLFHYFLFFFFPIFAFLSSFHTIQTKH